MSSWSTRVSVRSSGFAPRHHYLLRFNQTWLESRECHTYAPRLRLKRIHRKIAKMEEEIAVRPNFLNVPWWARLPYACPRHPAIERSTGRHSSNRSAHRLRLLLPPKSTVPLATVFPRALDDRATARVSPSYLSRGLRCSAPP